MKPTPLTPPADVSHLLKPRYKVIADWPGNNIQVGTIIELKDGDDKRFSGPYAYTANGAEAEYTLEPYPHLFKPLAWYEEREESEMPGYVKSVDGYFVCKPLYHPLDPVYFFLDEEGADQLILNDFLPATQSEYETYINKTK